MSIHVQMTHTGTGDIKTIKVGVSWTVVFFGVWPLLFRGMTSNFFKFLFLNFVTLGISTIWLIFNLNKKTAMYWFDRGYRPTGSGWDYASVKWNLPNLKPASSVAV